MSEDAPEKIAAKVMAIDIKITEEYEKVKDEPQKPLRFIEKAKIILRRQKVPNTPEYDSLLFGYVEGDILRDIALLWTKCQFDEQISQIITRLDNLENEVKSLKEKLNTRQRFFFCFGVVVSSKMLSTPLLPSLDYKLFNNLVALINFRFRFNT